MQKKIVILFPTWLEAETFIMRYGGEYEAVKAGVGLAECAARTAKIIAERCPDILILAGIAGAYADSGLRKGETVIVERENSYDLGAMRGDRFLPLAKAGGDAADNYYNCPYTYASPLRKVISNSVNIAASGYGNGKLPGASIENMEGASFFAVCGALGVKFAEIRTISNIVGEDPGDWNVSEAVRRLACDIKAFIGELDKPLVP